MRSSETWHFCQRYPDPASLTHLLMDEKKELRCLSKNVWLRKALIQKKMLNIDRGKKIGVFLHKTCSRYSKMNVAGRQVHSKTYLNKAWNKKYQIVLHMACFRSFYSWRRTPSSSSSSCQRVAKKGRKLRQWRLKLVCKTKWGTRIQK